MNPNEERELEERARIQAYHNSLPHVQDLPRGMDPSGLVPYPCLHGIPAKPKRFPPTRNVGVWLNEQGDELPPFGGRSWGRAKYLVHLEPVNIQGKVITYQARCHVCLGLPVGDDFYVAADGTLLR